MRVVDPGWARGDAPEQQKPGYQESQRELLELRERFSSVHSDQKASFREQALYEGVSSLGCFNNGQKSCGMPKKSKNNKKRLVVIAGPSCSGKTWLIKQIRSETPSKFASLVQKKCKIRGYVLANRLRLSVLRKDWNRAEGRIQERFGRGGYLHFDLTGRQQRLKRKILDELMRSADQIIVLNIVIGFEQWIEVNKLRKVEEPEHSPSTFVKAMLRLNARDPLAARQCYTYVMDRWQQYLELSPLKKCITVESRQANFLERVDRDRLGLVKLTRLQEVWLKIRFATLLAKAS